MISLNDPFDYRELKSFDGSDYDIPSKEFLYNLHQNQLSNGITNENHVVEIIEILGGSVEIQSQCDVNRRFLQFKSLNKQPIKYILQDHETFLHHYLKHTTADKVICFLYHKYTKAAIIILHGIWSLWWIVLSPNWGSKSINFSPNFTYKLLHLPVVCIWQFFVILSTNKKIFSQLTSSFLFWFKMWFISKYVFYYLIICYYYEVYGYRHKLGAHAFLS